jgi:hypothetical protein
MISFDITKIPSELMAKLSPDFHLLLAEQKKIEHQEKIDRVMAILDELSTGEVFACGCDIGRSFTPNGLDITKPTLCRNKHKGCNTDNRGDTWIMKGKAFNDIGQGKYIEIDIGRITDIYELNNLLRDVDIGCILVMCDFCGCGGCVELKISSCHINGIHGYDFDTIKDLCESAYDEYGNIIPGVDNYMNNLLLITKETSKSILQHAILSGAQIHRRGEKNIAPSKELIDALDSISSGPVCGCKCYMKCDEKVDLLCKLQHLCCYIGSGRSAP